MTADLLGDRLVIVTDIHADQPEHRLLETIEEEPEVWGTYASLQFRFGAAGVLTAQRHHDSLAAGGLFLPPLREKVAR